MAARARPGVAAEHVIARRVDDPRARRGVREQVGLDQLEEGRVVGQGLRHGRAGQQCHTQATFHHPLGGLDVVELHDAAGHYAGTPE